MPRVLADGYDEAAPGDSLNPGEQRVAELVARGLSDKQAAARLFLNAHTVEAHLSGAYAKLGIRPRRPSSPGGSA